MVDDNSRQRGQWVFRNQRWHYLAADYGQEQMEPTPVDPSGLLSLVDVGELLGTVEVLQQLHQQPFVLSVVDY